MNTNRKKFTSKKAAEKFIEKNFLSIHCLHRGYDSKTNKTIWIVHLDGPKAPIIFD